MNSFLTDYQMASLVEAIQTAENHTRGEIKVHIDSTTEGNNAQIAFEVFKRLCENKTVAKTAVLFHVNFEQQYLTIIGDEGIHQKVHQRFWDKMHDEITIAFSNQKYFEGLKSGILQTGLELKKHFPVVGENPNELPNEITFS